jgi:transcriptional regulator with XRE-family HTH domain
METLSQRIARRMRELMRTNPALDTQIKVRDRSGVSQASVQRILSGKQSATLDMVEQLSPAFGFKRADGLLLEADELELLNTWGELTPTEKATALGYIRVVLQTRGQLLIDAGEPVPAKLQAVQKASVERPAKSQVKIATHATQTRKRSRK